MWRYAKLIVECLGKQRQAREESRWFREEQMGKMWEGDWNKRAACACFSI